MRPIQPDWPAPPWVRAFSTTRAGGVSAGPFASLNLGDHVGDDPRRVARNRARLQTALRLPAPPRWLNQVHGTDCVRAEDLPSDAACRADALMTGVPDQVCAVLTADCLPLLFCDDRGECVAAVHAGWRGLAAGVVERTVAAMALPPERLLVWLGPAIGPAAFAVGGEVREVFVAADPGAAAAFAADARIEGSAFLADIFLLARRRLAALGIRRIHGGGDCTFSQPRRFFSYRRDGVTGRMATLIWLASDRRDRTL